MDLSQPSTSAAASLDSADRDDEKSIIVGICAMEKKSRAKPMAEILTRMQDRYPRLKVYIFDDNVIFNEPVENWKICDSLICFYSSGFPLDKAIKYVKLRRPYVINDLQRQYDLLDRTKIYEKLHYSGIRVPRHTILRRKDDEECPTKEPLEEELDLINVKGETFVKPFVEKPVNAENHNIVIYFPSTAGGGSQWLFRKVGDKSSIYNKDSLVRRTGSYLYEEYLPTDGVDVKVYAVGPFYAHAEARKSPGLDGKVERDRSGKEIRYPVILSNVEKMIARRVVLAFQQNVCGFDLLRSNGKSYVCDVNGFSFVKNSNKYYDDAANILGNMIMRRLAPSLHIPWSPHFQIDDPPLARTTTGQMMELRCVIAVIRHGDRTPKQKMKMEVRHPRFFELFRKFGGYKKGYLKLKRPDDLQEILDLARDLLFQIEHATATAQNGTAHSLENEDFSIDSASLFAGLTNLGATTNNNPVPEPNRPNLSMSHSMPAATILQNITLSAPESEGRQCFSSLASTVPTSVDNHPPETSSNCSNGPDHNIYNIIIPPARGKASLQSMSSLHFVTGDSSNESSPLGSANDVNKAGGGLTLVNGGALDGLHPCMDLDEMKTKLEQLKDVLEMYGHFSGLNRKVQMKYLSFGGSSHSSDAHCSSTEAEQEEREPSLLLILKWGGELTPAGRQQAEELGKAFRRLYPGSIDSELEDGLGFLRLHSTYRHDLRIYASEEGRVQSTAGAFTKGLLALEGEIAPILVQMVRSANTSGLLEDCQSSRRLQNGVKRCLSDYLQQDIELSEEDIKILNPMGDTNIQRCLRFIGNPYQMCERIYQLINQLVWILHHHKEEHSRSPYLTLYVNESLILMDQRWSKLLRDFKRTQRGRVTFDISKIPDIYDNAKYCYEHNAKAIQFEQIDDLYILSKSMADVIVHQEYGITQQEKLTIGEGICAPLLEKIKIDLHHSITGDTEEEAFTRLDPRYTEDIATPMRHVRTRLYFTSESHIHSLMNMIRYGGLCDAEDEQWKRALDFLNDVAEFNYMSQLVMMLYEDTSRDPGSDERFHVEIHFSPGALPCIATSIVPKLGYRSSFKAELPGTENNFQDSDQGTPNIKLSSPLQSPVSFQIGGVDGSPGSCRFTFGSDLNREEGLQLMRSVTEDPCDRGQVALSSDKKSASVATIGSGPFTTDGRQHFTKVASSLKNALFPHFFKRIRTETTHTLISTAVISGKMHETIIENQPCASRASQDSIDIDNLGVSQIVKNSSMPNLNVEDNNFDTVSVIEGTTVAGEGEENVSEFVPPLRSLETLHNRLSHRQLVEWIDRHTHAAHAFASSPPRSPLAISREISGLEMVCGSSRT